jgi:hypothetical protein
MSNEQVPFFNSWKKWYILLLIFLAAQMIAYYLLELAFS